MDLKTLVQSLNVEITAEMVIGALKAGLAKPLAEVLKEELANSESVFLNELLTIWEEAMSNGDIDNITEAVAPLLAEKVSKDWQENGYPDEFIDPLVEKVWEDLDMTDLTEQIATILAGRLVLETPEEKSTE